MVQPQPVDTPANLRQITGLHPRLDRLGKQRRIGRAQLRLGEDVIPMRIEHQCRVAIGLAVAGGSNLLSIVDRADRGVGHTVA